MSDATPPRGGIEVRLGHGLYEASLPVPIVLARSALARLDELPFAAKLALGRDGNGALVAEIPRLPRCEPEDARQQTRVELRRAEAWLNGGKLRAPVVEGAIDPAQVEAALADAPCAFERLEGGAWRVSVMHERVARRLLVEAIRPGALRVLADGGVPLGSAEVLDALTVFCLDSNRRLKLARMSVRPEGDLARLRFSFVLPGTLPLATGLPRVVDAVVSAQALCERAVGALARAGLARPYLTFRTQGRPGDVGTTRGGKKQWPQQ